MHHATFVEQYLAILLFPNHSNTNAISFIIILNKNVETSVPRATIYIPAVVTETMRPMRIENEHRSAFLDVYHYHGVQKRSGDRKDRRPLPELLKFVPFDDKHHDEDRKQDKSIPTTPLCSAERPFKIFKEHFFSSQFECAI